MKENLEEMVEVQKLILDAARRGEGHVKIFTQLMPENKRNLSFAGYDVEETTYPGGEYKTVIRW